MRLFNLIERISGADGDAQRATTKCGEHVVCTTLRDSFRATRVRGLVVNYGSVSGSLNDLDPIELGESGSLFLTRPRLAGHLADAQTVQRRADDVFAALADGSLTIAISARYKFDQVEEAHAELEARRQVGKSVLMIG